MGKALFFNGITITSPLSSVTFDDGLSNEVRTYINALSVEINQEQKVALQNFYNTLVTNNLWDGFEMIYPMFGSVQDCAIGLKGKKLIIPNGAEYNKGLFLKNVTGGGVGYTKTGILLKEYPNAYITKDVTFYYNIDYNIYEGGLISFTRDIDNEEPSDYGCTAYINRGTLEFVNFGQNLNQPIKAGIIAYSKHTSANIAESYVNENKKTDSNKGALANAKYLGLNSWSNVNHTITKPFNMVMISNSYHTEEQVKIVMDAIRALKKALFV